MAVDEAPAPVASKPPQNPHYPQNLVCGRAPFPATMLVASAGELASAFGWPRAAAGAVLEELVGRGEAVGEAGSYRPARRAAHAEDHARRCRGGA
ncbi:MAG TPA: hypothetical protein VIV12_19045 [Streptosporangiaceae bacterium]